MGKNEYEGIQFREVNIRMPKAIWDRAAAGRSGFPGTRDGYFSALIDLGMDFLERLEKEAKERPGLDEAPPADAVNHGNYEGVPLA